MTSFNWFHWSAVGYIGRKSVEPLFGSCNATLHCPSSHPCSLPWLHICRGVRESWTKLKVCTYLPGAALRITGSRQESDLSLRFSTGWRINKNIFVGVWEPLGCTVLRHLAAAENPTLMFIQVMTWAPSTPACRQQEPGAIGIFEDLRSVNWHFLKIKSLWVDYPWEKAPCPQIAPAWALAMGPDNINKLWAWLTALSETVKKTETPMTAFTFRSCWWNY